MSEVENTTVATPETAPEGEKKFSQADVDAIVKSRLDRERGKYSDYEDLKAKAEKFDAAEEAQKTELQKATERAEALQAQLDSMNRANEVRNTREKVSQELGVPVSLLTGEDEETCRNQGMQILEFAKKTTYPTVQDGGETHTPAMTKAEILSIKNNKERLKAIEENIELFQ